MQDVMPACAVISGACRFRLLANTKLDTPWSVLFFANNTGLLVVKNFNIKYIKSGLILLYRHMTICVCLPCLRIRGRGAIFIVECTYICTHLFC